MFGTFKTQMHGANIKTSVLRGHSDARNASGSVHFTNRMWRTHAAIFLAYANHQKGGKHESFWTPLANILKAISIFFSNASRFVPESQPSRFILRMTEQEKPVGISPRTWLHALQSNLMTFQNALNSQRPNFECWRISLQQTYAEHRTSLKHLQFQLIGITGRFLSDFLADIDVTWSFPIHSSNH